MKELDKEIKDIIDYLQFSDKFVNESYTRNAHSKEIAEYYKRVYEESGNDMYNKMSLSVGGCLNSWFFKIYEDLKIAENTSLIL